MINLTRLPMGLLMGAAIAVMALPAAAQVVDRTGQGRVSRCDLFRDLGRALPPECGGSGPAASGEQTRGRIVIGRPDRNAPPAAQPTATAPRQVPSPTTSAAPRQAAVPAAPAPAPMAAPSPMAAPVAAPQPAAMPAPTRETPRTVALMVQFELGSAKLTPSAQRTLDDLAAVIQANASDRFVIEGHTDARGSDALNQELSELRAQSAIDYLANRHGIERNRLEARGYGRSRPLVASDPFNPRNRRVQVSNVGS